MDLNNLNPMNFKETFQTIHDLSVIYATEKLRLDPNMTVTDFYSIYEQSVDELLTITRK